jgi:FkbM family methyltransferase
MPEFDTGMASSAYPARYGAATLRSLVKMLPGSATFNFRAASLLIKRSMPQRRVLTYFGSTMNVDVRDLVSRMIFWFGRWEPNLSSAIESILAEGDVFVDVGANIGYYSLLASKLVGPGGQVVAIEALPSTHALLKRNLSDNGVNNVRTANVAVSDAAGQLTVYSGIAGNTGSATTVPIEGRQPIVTVDALPLNEILTLQERENVALIKIDIEGAEVTVLRQILDTIHLYPEKTKIIVEMTPSTGDVELDDLFSSVLSAGFQAYKIENKYDWDSYLQWVGGKAPEPVNELPGSTCDILFRRPEPYSGSFY